jgi:photosystem II stability/assembly factor-like uncharacterized protein
MKKFYSIIVVFLFIHLSVQAQFNVCPHGTYNMGTVYSYAVDDQVYWASRRDVTGTTVTADGGNTWTTSSFTDPKAYPVYCIHAFNADVAFVTASTIYKTTDRGTTWTAVSGAFTNSASFPNTIHFFDENNGVAMGDPVDGYFEIYTTTNAGVNWNRVPQVNIPAPLAGEVGQVDLHAYYNNSYWFMTNNYRLFRSTDRGYNWACSQLPPLTGGYISMAFRDELHGLADNMIGSNFAMGRTSDGGDTWTYVLMPGWITNWTNLAYIPGTQSSYTINSIGYSGNELRAMILFTTDDGANWHRLDDWGAWIDGSGLGFHQWAGVNSGWGSLYQNNSGCIYHWPGYTGKHIWRAGSSVKFGSMLLGNEGDTYAISVGNYGSLPTTVNALTISSNEFTLINPPSFPLVLQPWECIDLNIKFTPQTRGLLHDSLTISSDAVNNNILSTALFGKGLQFTPLQSNYIYAAAESLYTFTLANLNAMPVGDFDRIRIVGLTISPTDSVLFGISTNTVSSVLYKIDPIVGGLLPLVTIPVANIRAIAFSPNGTLFAGQRNGTLYSIDIGTGAATQIGTSSGKAYSSFSFSPRNGKLYASVMPAIGTNRDGIYTVDITTGAATHLGNTGDGKITLAIAFNYEGTLYGLKGTSGEINKLITIVDSTGFGTEIGTLGRTGLQTIIMSDIITNVREDDDGNSIKSFSLAQNFPNPFNPSTTFSYSIPTQSKVVIKVFDILGNEIATLMDEEKSVGTYELTWNAANLSSSIYFYQMKAGEYVNTKKMILLK